MVVLFVTLVVLFKFTYEYSDNFTLIAEPNLSVLFSIVNSLSFAVCSASFAAIRDTVTSASLSWPPLIVHAVYHIINIFESVGLAISPKSSILLYVAVSWRFA